MNPVSKQSTAGWSPSGKSAAGRFERLPTLLARNPHPTSKVQRRRHMDMRMSVLKSATATIPAACSQVINPRHQAARQTSEVQTFRRIPAK